MTTRATLVSLHWRPMLCNRQRTELQDSTNNESLYSCSLYNESGNTEPLCNEQLCRDSLYSSSHPCTASPTTMNKNWTISSDDIPPLTKADELLATFNSNPYVDDRNDVNSDHDVIIDVEGEYTNDFISCVRNDGICHDGRETSRWINNENEHDLEKIEMIEEIEIDYDDDVLKLFHNCFPLVIDIY